MFGLPVPWSPLYGKVGVRWGSAPPTVDEASTPPATPRLIAQGFKERRKKKAPAFYDADY
jgi:hypothetical protein